MDYIKWARAFGSIDNDFCYQDEYVEEERKGISVLDTNNAKKFFERIKKYSVTKKELCNLMSVKCKNDKREILNYQTSLLIDFDKKDR